MGSRDVDRHPLTWGYEKIEKVASLELKKCRLLWLVHKPFCRMREEFLSRQSRLILKCMNCSFLSSFVLVISLLTILNKIYNAAEFKEYSETNNNTEDQLFRIKGRRFNLIFLLSGLFFLNVSSLFRSDVENGRFPLSVNEIVSAQSGSRNYWWNWVV